MIAPLTGVLVIFLFAMVAFTVDIGYIVQTKEELQNAADAAALAGAGRLADYELTATFTPSGSLSLVSGPASTTAVNEAVKFAQKNVAGGGSVVMNQSDVTVGYRTFPSTNAPFQAVPPANTFPNSVHVVARRDSQVSTGPLKLFFAPVLGISTADVQAKATATVWGGTRVIGFKGIPGMNSLLLPIALDATAWNAMVSLGTMPTGYTVQDLYTVVRPTTTLQSPNNVTSGTDGIPEMVGVYPNPIMPGDFGLVVLGPDTSAAGDFQNWITNGPSTADLTYLAQNQNPVSGSTTWTASVSAPATVTAGPGLKASEQTALQSIIGQPRIMPLYSTAANGTYTITGFAGVTIVEAVLTGSNKHITIQPTAVLDPTAVTALPTVTANSSFVYGIGGVSLTR
jgi:Flp pilus assembly protein TadG